MRTFARNRSLQVILLGGFIMAISVLFEYARMAPNYRFIVDPWSMRGTELTQGWVMVAIAVEIGVLASLVTYHVIPENIVGGTIAASVATALAIVISIAADPRDVIISTFGIWGLALFGASAASASIIQALPQSVTGWTRRGIITVTWVGSLLLLGSVILKALFESARPLWLVILVGFLLMSAGVLMRKPRELAAHRLLINSSVIALLVAMTIGGSVRTALIEKQVETLGVGGDLLNSQITSGVMMTWFGAVLMILGSVAMWAKRRDQLDAKERARRQRAAAEKSAQELGERFASRV